MIDKMKPLVSVIMPTYNTSEEMLRECIDSVLNQSYKNFEFIIIDDGSENNSVEVIKSYGDNRIKLYKNCKNIGLTKNLFRCIELAQGEYIARMDSDDVCFPDRLEKQVLFLEKHRKYVAVAGNALILGSNKLFYVSKNMPRAIRMIRLLYSNAGFVHPTIMFRTSALIENHINYNIEYSKSQDYDMWCQIMKVGDIYNLNEPILYYRIHDKQISKVSNDEQTLLKNKIKMNYAKQYGFVFSRNQYIQFLKLEDRIVVDEKTLIDVLRIMFKTIKKNKLLNPILMALECNYLWHDMTRGKDFKRKLRSLMFPNGLFLISCLYIKICNKLFRN